MQPLYKFIDSPDVAEYFLAGRIKFTPISELNDPSELTSNVLPEKVYKSLNKIRITGYNEEDLLQLQQQGAVLNKLAPRFQATPVPNSIEGANRLIRSSFYDQTDLLVSVLSKTANEISKKVGVFCLTKRLDSLPMWAHYANNAKGLVVEFEKLDSVFNGDETGVLWSLIDIRYQKEKGGVTFDPKSHDALFFEKFSDWSYEQEVRVVAVLDTCDTMSLENGHRIYFFDLPPSKVKRLILGWKMSQEKVNFIKQKAHEMHSTADIVQARFENGRICF